MSNNNELISIIVPVYNVQKYLDRCMNTLLNQTYKNIEIILIDDESPDSCPQMCDEYKRIDQRIKVVHKLNEGLGFARNSGLEIARGKYIIFVDSDDYVTENMCELLYQSAKKYDADVVYGGIFYADGKNIKESKAVTKKLNLYCWILLQQSLKKKKIQLWRFQYGRLYLEKKFLMIII